MSNLTGQRKMSKFLDTLFLATSLMAFAPGAFAADPAAGEAVFKKCAACHMVGEGAKNKVGPVLNDVIARKAGAIEGYKYSKAMITAGEGGLAWTEENLAAYLANPKGFIKGTAMSFAGLKKEEDVANVVAYLATFSAGATKSEAAPAQAKPAEQAAAAPAATETAKPAAEETKSAELPAHGVYHLGRAAAADEIAAWDLDVSPDGSGLPEGKGSVADGEGIFSEKCAACHGEFAEGVDNWPKLAGGDDTLDDDDPLKTVGSYWPYLSTAWDYVHRSMPFGGAQVLTPDETYAIVAYILYSNNLVADDFVLSKDNFLEVKMPNADGFIVDDRPQQEYAKWRAEPCMKDCKPSVEITKRATILDVTPDTVDDENKPKGAVE
jgi:cytochrome c